MDWDFLEEEIMETLDGSGINSSTVDRFESLVRKFINRLAENYQEEGDFDDAIDTEWYTP